MPKPDYYDWEEEANAVPIESIEHARKIIAAWMRDAAMYCRNANYYRDERDRIIKEYTPKDSPERLVLRDDLLFL